MSTFFATFMDTSYENISNYGETWHIKKQIFFITSLKTVTPSSLANGQSKQSFSPAQAEKIGRYTTVW